MTNEELLAAILAPVVCAFGVCVYVWSIKTNLRRAIAAQKKLQILINKIGADTPIRWHFEPSRRLPHEKDYMYAPMPLEPACDFLLPVYLDADIKFGKVVVETYTRIPGYSRDSFALCRKTLGDLHKENQFVIDFVQAKQFEMDAKK